MAELLSPHTNQEIAICFLFPQTYIKYLQLFHISEELQETLSGLHNIQQLSVVCSTVLLNNCQKYFQTMLLPYIVLKMSLI